MSNTTEIEAVLFKRSGDRYVYQSPNPWVFGRSKRYLVTEAQKAELMSLIAARRPKLRIALVMAIVLFWAAAASLIVWALSPHEDPTAIDALAIAALALIPLYLSWVAALQRQLRRIQPIIDGAPPTQERITRPELRKALSDSMSMRKSLLLALTWAFTCATQVFSLVIRNGYHPLFSDVQSWLNTFTAVLGAGLALYYLAVAIHKIESRAERRC
jgi:hypothetical protein